MPKTKCASAELASRSRGQCSQCSHIVAGKQSPWHHAAADAEEQVNRVQRDAQRNMELMQQQMKKLSRDSDQRIRDRLKKLVSYADDHDKPK